MSKSAIITRRAIMEVGKLYEVKVKLPSSVIKKIANPDGIETLSHHYCNNDFIITENVHIEFKDKKHYENAWFSGNINTTFVRNSSGIEVIFNTNGLKSGNTTLGTGVVIIRVSNSRVIKLSNIL